MSQRHSSEATPEDPHRHTSGVSSVRSATTRPKAPRSIYRTVLIVGSLILGLAAPLVLLVISYMQSTSFLGALPNGSSGELEALRFNLGVCFFAQVIVVVLAVIEGARRRFRAGLATAIVMALLSAAFFWFSFQLRYV